MKNLFLSILKEMNSYICIYKRMEIKFDHKLKTVKELRVIAKRRGLVGYWKLRKADLIAAIDKGGMIAAIDKGGSLLDSPVPDIRVPILTPRKYVSPAIPELKTKVRSNINSFADWLISYVPPEVKKPVNERLETLKSEIGNLFGIINTRKFKIRKTASAIKGFTKQYTIDGSSGIDAVSFLNAVRPQVVGLMATNRQVKVQLVLTCAMERVDMKSGEEESANVPFVSKTEVILDATDINEVYDNAINKIPETMASFQMRGSNWRFGAVLKLDINTAVYKPLKGSSYIVLPAYLANKKAIINMKNSDDQCFKWCITRALNPTVNNSERITKELKEQSRQFNWNGIEFPVAADANVISKFERNNSCIRINLFGYENKIIFPIYVSNQREVDRCVDLLLISDGDKKHYCWIKNFNRLMALRTEKSHNSMHYCRRCLNGYRRIEALNKHTEYCSQNTAQKVEVPEPGTTLSFKNYNRSMRVPFIIYGDFESFIKPIDTCQPDPRVSYTHKYQKHTPSSFCYYVKCFDNSVYHQDPVTFTAETEDDDVGQIFVDSLEETTRKIYNQFKFPKNMIFTPDDRKIFNSCTNCHICGETLGKDRVRDHCHLSGKFRGAAHNSCNLDYKVPKFFPVVLHNLSGYDSHLFVKKLRGDHDEKINCIPNNEEKYISFSREVIVDKFINKEGKEIMVRRELRFIDSFRFMASSLDALSKNLKKDQCKNLGAFYSGKQFDLLLRKGVYPYEFVDSVERLNDSRTTSEVRILFKTQ